MEPDLMKEIYRLTRENNQMLHAMRRQAFWGWMFKLVLYLLALGIPIWLYFTYLSPIVQQFQETISTATGQRSNYSGQFGELMQLYEQFKEQFGSGSSTNGQ